MYSPHATFAATSFLKYSKVASALGSGRFWTQGSESRIAKCRYGKTSLEDTLGAERTRINDGQIYRWLDARGGRNEKLCAHPIGRDQDWLDALLEFPLDECRQQPLRRRGQPASQAGARLLA